MASKKRKNRSLSRARQATKRNEGRREQTLAEADDRTQDGSVAGFSQRLSDPRAMEDVSRDLKRLLEQRGFANIEEANRFLSQVIANGKVPRAEPRSDLDRAQDVIYRALSAEGSERTRFANEALSLSHDCADAYVLLAEELDLELDERARLYQLGVEAAERVLGPKPFEEDVGHFYGILETRPYIRARSGLADCLRVMGNQKAAATHYEAILKLNEADNLGVRYLLCNVYLELGWINKARELLERFAEEECAWWAFSRALVSFHLEGVTDRSKADMILALKGNRFVAPYLLSEKRLPPEIPDHYGRGDENEAMIYSANSTDLWKRERGALSFLRIVRAEAGRSRTRRQ